MPPVALTCLKYAVEPQLSDSPICAYTPESASSLQTTMVLLLLAELPPPELQAASRPAARTVAAAAAILNGVRLRIIVLPSWYCCGFVMVLAADEQRVDNRRGTEVGGTAVEDEVAAGQHEDSLADLGDERQVVLD